MASPLARLEQVDLRDVWPSESAGFTPWLGQPENLAILGESIGLELECEAQERGVGPFRADILCRDTATGNWVLIENQLERTDHCHLGQLLTYAAGLKTVTIVWVAQHFAEEHRAALDWLNEITDDRFEFFGLAIELWRIGESLPAPKFNVVCKPNDWSRRISEAATASEGELSGTQTLYLEYWQGLKAHLEDSKSSVRMKKPQPQMWMVYPVGRTNFYLTTNISRTKRLGCVQFVMSGPDHVAYFRLVQKDAQQIEAELGPDLKWRELPDRKESQIRREFRDWDVEDRVDWPRQHQMIRETLERFSASFRPRVKSLDLADVEEDELNVVSA